MSQKHILLVDDEDDIREVAGISLEAVGGWQVSRASSGVEGIAKALAERPDAILLDVDDARHRRPRHLQASAG